MDSRKHTCREDNGCVLADDSLPDLPEDHPFRVEARACGSVAFKATRSASAAYLTYCARLRQLAVGAAIDES